MILISHRGNTEGKKPGLENGQRYCEEAIEKGFDVEIDVHWYEGIFWTGHDRPQYRVRTDILKRKEVWCHAKNILALKMMLKEDIHCFWHQEDDVTLTSRGYIWTYPGKYLTEKSICVLPKKFGDIYNKSMGIDECYGICSDYILEYKEKN